MFANNCLKTNQELAFKEKISLGTSHMKSYMDETVVLVLSLHHQKVISETRILYEKNKLELWIDYNEQPLRCPGACLP